MANTSLRLIAAQEKHIRLLTEKLNKLKSEQLFRFTATPGWPLFILRNTSTYSRGGSNRKGEYLAWAADCDVSMVSEEDGVYLKCQTRKQVYTTHKISIDEFDEFLNNSFYDELSQQTSTTWSGYWSTDNLWTSDEKSNNSTKKYGKGVIKNFYEFLQGAKPEYF